MTERSFSSASQEQLTDLVTVDVRRGELGVVVVVDTIVYDVYSSKDRDISKEGLCIEGGNKARGAQDLMYVYKIISGVQCIFSWYKRSYKVV